MLNKRCKFAILKINRENKINSVFSESMMSTDINSIQREIDSIRSEQALRDIRNIIKQVKYQTDADFIV